MADFTFASVADRFPVGTTVSARKRSNWLSSQQDSPTGTPGSADTTAVVASDGSLTFTGLVADTRYIAHATVGSAERYVQFGTWPLEGEPAQNERLDAVETSHLGPDHGSVANGALRSALSFAGPVEPGSSVAVKDLAGNALTVFSAGTGATTTSSTVTADSSGRIPGFVEAPDYDLSVAGASLTYTRKVRRSPPGHYHAHSYGCKGDGVNDTTGLQALRDAAMGSIVTDPGGSSLKRGRARIVFGAGAYKTTTGDALWQNTATASFGLMMSGLGEGVTQIIFAPTIAGKYLMTNDQDLIGLHVMDIEFHGDATSQTPSLLHMIGPTAQYATFDRCTSSGTWKYGIHKTGLDNASEVTLTQFSLGFGVYEIFLYDQGDPAGDDQLVNNFLIDCKLEITSGIIIQSEKGGHYVVRGGSLIISGTGQLYNLLGTTHDRGSMSFYWGWQRVELRSATATFGSEEWPYGNFVMEGIDGVAAGTLYNSTVTATFKHSQGANSAGPIVSVRDCMLPGQFKMIYGNGSYAQKRIYDFERSTFWAYPTAREFFIFEHDVTTGGERVGSKPVVRVRRCRGSGGSVYLVDCDLNREYAMNFAAEERWIRLSAPDGSPKNAFPGQNLQLELYQRITKLRGYCAPDTFAAAMAGSTWTIADSQTPTPKTLVIFKPDGDDARNGFNWEVDVNHIADSATKSLITFVASAAVSQQITGAGFIVEALVTL